MKNAVMISIRPHWCEKIASGEKTIEVRKTRPQVETPFKCYIYCTNAGGANRLVGSKGKVIGEFVCDNIMDISISISNQNAIKKEYPFPCTGMTDIEVMNYLGNGKAGYGWHISDLVIYDIPKHICDFNHCGENYHFNPSVTKAPQSWCYVEVLE